MSKLALLDIDSMVIAAGALGEEVYYVVDNVRFDNKTQANEYCDDHVLDRKNIERKVDAMPAVHAIGILKQIVQAAVKEAGCDSYEAYLSPIDKSNFRFDIYPEYKANRKNVVKPVHFMALRNYCVKTLGAHVVSGMEADDMLAIRAFELGFEDVVIVSVDKDMRQIPTYHYDWRKKGEVVKVEELEAWRNLYSQILIGDSVDNIKGCPKIGPAKAKAALKGALTEQDMLSVCKDLYIKAYDGDETEAMEMLKVNAQLLMLLNKRPTS